MYGEIAEQSRALEGGVVRCGDSIQSTSGHWLEGEYTRTYLESRV